MTHSPAPPPLHTLLQRKSPLLMGIVNVTPDSFSDGGLFDTSDAASRQAVQLADEGADIVDVGGESTRPGHAPLSLEEEQARVLPVLARIVPVLAARGIPVSIDTYKAATARRALTMGARIVNDIWGLQREPDIAHVAADAGADVIIMHNRETIDPAIDILADMQAFFERSLTIAQRAGLPDSAIVLDPGIGFGKTAEQGMRALADLPALCALGFPVLVGASRKSFIGKLLDLPVTERLYGTLGAHLFAAEHGAAILRVHDVRPHAQALRVMRAIADAGLH